MSFKTLQALRKIVVDTPSFESNHAVALPKSVTTKEYVDNEVMAQSGNPNAIILPGVVFNIGDVSMPPVSITLRQRDQVVDMFISGTTVTTVLGGAMVSPPGVIPVGWRPSATQYTSSINCLVGAFGGVVGVCYVGSSGSITIQPAILDTPFIKVNPSVFPPATPTCGTNGNQCIRYCL